MSAFDFDGVWTLLMYVSLWAGASACSSSGTDAGTGSTGATYAVTISNFAFSPNPIVVPAGGTLVFKNMDGMPHSATSEAAGGAFVNGQADGGFTFDTGDIPGGATAMLVVPATLSSGTVQPYFCKVHTNAMMPPNPTIQVQ